jgi:hypothetical protein
MEQQTTHAELTAEESAWLEAFRKLSAEQRELVLQILAQIKTQ